MKFPILNTFQIASASICHIFKMRIQFKLPLKVILQQNRSTHIPI